MENTQLVENMNQKIKNDIDELRHTINKLTHTFQNLLNRKIESTFGKLSKEELDSIFDVVISDHLNKELEALLKYLETTEIEFYSNKLHTAELIFNDIKEVRQQRIYLDNVIKKIEQKEVNTGFIFSESLRKKIDNVEHLEEDENLSIDEMFSYYAKVVIKNHHTSFDEAKDLKEVLKHYYDIFRNDISSDILSFLLNNKETSITAIETVIDQKMIRGGKSSALYKLEKNITKDALERMKSMIESNISGNKTLAVEELKGCSTDMVDLIFEELPDEYKDQKSLLEVIIDTSINERLGILLEEELQKLNTNLFSKDQDIIVNELYDEKRYKKIPDYEFDYEIISGLYRQVLTEIRLAYDIPENHPKSIRLNWVVLNRSTSTKDVFKNLFESIYKQNKKDLTEIIVAMRQLSTETHITAGVGIENEAPIKK